MTAVPLSFEAEPGYIRCGNSFERTIVVTGEIPGRNGYGKSHKHTIGRVAKVPGGQWWSRKTPQEAAFRSQIEGRMEGVERDLSDNITQIPIAQAQAVEYLLALARGNLDRVDAIYAYWAGSGEHPQFGERLPVDTQAPSPFPGGGTYARPSEWPLTESDAIYEYVPECQGKAATWVDDYELVLSEMKRVRKYFCPGVQTIERRAEDRKDILELLLDAARAVRCAQYGVWRIVLYRRAIADWAEQYGGVGLQTPTEPRPQGPRPGSDAQIGGGFVSPTRPIEPPDLPGNPPGLQPQPGNIPFPPTPLDWPIPDPGTLPDPGPLGDQGPGGGTTTEDPSKPAGGAGAIFPRVPSLVPLAIAGAAVGLYFFTKGTNR